MALICIIDDLHGAVMLITKDSKL